MGVSGLGIWGFRFWGSIGALAFKVEGLGGIVWDRPQ